MQLKRSSVYLVIICKKFNDKHPKNKKVVIENVTKSACDICHTAGTLRYTASRELRG